MASRAAATAAAVIGALIALSGCSTPREHYERGYHEALYDSEWPFTVEEFEFVCVGDDKVVVETEGGTQYALNGRARGTGEWPSADAIIKDDPDMPATAVLPQGKMNVMDVISIGLRLCD